MTKQQGAKLIDIGKYIDPDFIIPDLTATTSNEAIKALIDRITAVKPDFFNDDFTDSELYLEMSDHELIRSSGLENGLAVPHVRLEKCQDFICVIGVSKAGIDFNSKDGKLSHFICLMVSPSNEPYVILQALGSFSRFFYNQANVDALIEKTEPADIAEMIKHGFYGSTKSLLAGDLMRPVDKCVNLETSINETAKIMNIYHYDILPVTDIDGNMCGEISCLNIFSYGIPDFFNQLQTVSFVKHLDPFGKYFQYQQNLKVKDIYNKNAPVISDEATLMEIIFLVTARNQSTLYVVNNKKLAGIIDRFSILDKILFC